jgi:hypothetical protein
MPTEREKMLAGELYDPLHPELVAARERGRDPCHDLKVDVAELVEIGHSIWYTVHQFI